MEKSRRTLKSNIQNNINLKNNQEDKFNNVNKIEGAGKAKIKKKKVYGTANTNVSRTEGNSESKL